MRTSSDYDAIPPVKPAKLTQQVTPEREVHASAVSDPKYDSVALSSQTEESQFYQQLVGRLSKEVRTATSTGDIRRLQQEIADGTYQPDPMRIAARILYLNEEDE
jgi:negative regulator of flagellin synthesis FlgM